MGEAGEGERERRDRRRLGLGGEHTVQHTDDVLEKYTPETYIILLASVTPINSIKNKERNKLENP